MSLFLAPIHYWLFKKIKLYEELEKNIVSAYRDKYDENFVDEVVKECVEKFGDYIEDKPLESIIDTSNIHGWLQGNITKEESRSAFIFSKLIEKYGDESKGTGYEEVKEQALSAANEVSRANSPEAVFDILNEYILAGMPCDRVNSVTQKDSQKIVWEQERCIHVDNYKLGNGNINFMYEIRDLWVKTFVENISPGYIYDIKRDGEKSIHEIKLK